MTAAVPPESDIWLPLPKNDQIWNDHTIHTHYFGFSIPTEQIGAFIYLRYQPVYKILSGGVCIFKGTDNLKPLDCEHCNYVNTMPPETVGPLDFVKDNTIKTANGLTVKSLEPRKKVHYLHTAIEQRIEAEDEKGESYSFHGEVVAMAHLPSWPNNTFVDGVYRWTNEQDGRVAYSAYQEAYYHTYWRFCRGR